MKRHVLALLLLATPAVAQPAIPDTAPGHTLSAWLPAMNSADQAQLEAFNAQYHWAVPADRAVFMAQASGGYTLIGISEDKPDALAALLMEKDSGKIMKVTFHPAGTAADPTHITFDDTERPPGYAIARLPQAQANKALEARAAQLIAQGRFSGNMLVQHKGVTVYRKSWGLADRAGGTPVTMETKFRIGSDNKMFTAVAALQLVAAGKLSLDGTVGRYLPGYPDAEIASKVTIRMLLSHTGGTGDIFGPEFEKNQPSLSHNEDYVKLYGARAPAFEPGTQDAYSNYGFILLGSIVQHVSGEDYYDYVQRHVFAPAGMKDTGSLPESVAVPNRSSGYTREDGKWVINTATLPLRGTAAGGGYSTAGDLVKFGNALESGKLLPRALLEQATTPQNKGKWYGFGFGISGKGRTRNYGHGGGAPGMNAEFRVYPDAHVVIAVLANTDPPAATRLMDYYADRMPLD